MAWSRKNHFRFSSAAQNAMPKFSTVPEKSRGKWLVLVIPLALAMLASAGCGGCNSKTKDPNQTEEDNAEQEKQVTKKKEDDLEIKPLRPLIGQELAPFATAEPPADDPGIPLLVKPGHWTTTIQEMQANYGDFVGSSSTTLVDSSQRAVPLEHTNFTFQATRPVALAKGRLKRIEGQLFIPEQSADARVRAQLRNRNSGAMESTGNRALLRMPSYQYFILVLSRESSKYGFLKVSDAIRMPWEEEFDAASQPHYRVVLADATKSLPLPSNVLTWTSVAYVFWDDVDPTRLAPEQQSALVDWLHWGGRLIISGPDSLDSLRSSFLAEYLPAESTGARTLTAEELSGWSAYWSRRDGGARPPQLKPTKPWSGITLKPHAEAGELAGGGQLFYERAIGRGAIVLSAIQLTQRDLINWPGYDSFLNAGLLRRPRRTFSEGLYDDERATWTEFPSHRLDAHLTTGLRFFARDFRTSANQTLQERQQSNQFGQVNTVTTSKIDRPGGIGTWNPFNPVANAARTVLTDAAAVRVPAGVFVLSCLGIYLVVLVPLNWMIFRAFDRVEWAWIAAPVIALLGTLVIVRQAQLDIGFVRSQTEVALLELQGNYPRGLLTRFTALYSSLSTTYDLKFNAPTAVATPFPASQSLPAIRENIWNVVLEKQNETHLSGLAVSSASTKMAHSEEIITLAGGLQLGKSSLGHDQLMNRLGYNMRDVVVVKRYFEPGGNARYASSWIGQLRDGEISTVGFQPLVPNQGQMPHQEQRTQAANGDQKTSVDIDALADLAFQFPESEDPLEQRRDECRVVGLIDQVLPGTEVSPVASQIVGTTVVVAHLQHGSLPQPEPDFNNSDDVVKEARSP